MVPAEENGSTIVPKKAKKEALDRPLPTLTIISHPDPGRMGNFALLHALAKGGVSELSRFTPYFIAPNQALGSPLADPFVSRNPIWFRPGRNGGIYLDPGEGKSPVTLEKRVLKEEVELSSEDLKQGVVLVLADRIVLLLHWTHENIAASRLDYGLVGHSDPIRFLRKEIARVADLATPVLLRGASGTGKELAARAIHDTGRPGKPFVSVNMAAIPASLAASELFGAVKGSFTGSSRHQLGYFRAAQGGSLFLDEIGETNLEVQVLLLRALETGEISPVGAQNSIKVATRLIAATDANLEAMMAEDSFKTPLFHRLAGYEISLPSLRERLEDFGRLFLHFARWELDDIGESNLLEPRGPKEDPWLPASLVVRLLRFSWPGNIRQLRNTVRQLLIGCRGENTLRIVPKLEQMLANDPAEVSTLSVESKHRKPRGIRRKPSTIGADELKDALRTARWNIKAAAETLGISRGALYLLIEKTPGLHKASELEANTILAGMEKHSGNVDALADALGVSARALRRRMTALDI